MTGTINLMEKFAFAELWSPKIVAEVNNFHVELVKLRGEFIWHHHGAKDELLFAAFDESRTYGRI